MEQCLVAFKMLLVPNQEFPEAVEPGVGCFHNPAPVLRGPAALPFLACNPGRVTTGSDLLLCGFPIISLIRIQESFLCFGKRDNDRIQHCPELADVMSVGPGNDQRQRDAMPVHQQVSLAPFFSPGPSGWTQRLRCPWAP